MVVLVDRISVAQHRVRSQVCHKQGKGSFEGDLTLVMIKKVNHSRYRPEQAQRVLRKLRFPDFVTTARDGGKVVSLTHRPPLPPSKCCWYSFLLEAESTPRP